MPNFNEAALPLASLLLDPNNYRFQDSADFVLADPKRFHEQSVQDRAYRRLRSETSLVELKKSFLTNGFVPVERLVVRKYAHKDNQYVVVEGNRRLAALRWISEDNAAGVQVPPDLIAQCENLPVIVLDATADESFYESLMGIRHVSGIKQWGGYQRAKLIVALRDTHGLSTSDTADRLGLSAQEVNRRYRAYKALEQMQKNEDYGSFAGPELYPLFHEAMALPIVREWMNWDEAKAAFVNAETVEQFYQLMTGSETEDGEPREPKITTYAQVRELRNILSSAEAKRILLDPARTYLDAVSVAKRDDLSKNWGTQVAEAIEALRTIGALDLQSMLPDDVAQITKLRDTASELLNTYAKLKA